jgi:Peptidase M50B-like
MKMARRVSAVMPSALWMAAVVSFVASLTPSNRYLLYPFKVFTTWIHECGHAVMTVWVGGSVHAISIEPDTSGLTASVVPPTRVAQALVASAGYLGAALVGCLLMAAARVDKWARPILWAVGAFMLLTLVIWIRNAFGFAVVLFWAAALIAIAHRGTGNLPRFVLSLLAIQVALASIYDIRVLFLLRDGHSDARTMAMLFLLPTWVWASLWMAVSVGMLAWTLRVTRGRSYVIRSH